MVFALFDLLGMQFAPRLRDIGDQQLYRISREQKARHLAPRFKGIIKQDLILRHWEDFLRLAGSLKLGWVTASLFISKLQAYPRQHVLARALQEYGRLVKTLFILRYLESQDYRRRINAQLNKGESLHALRDFLYAVLFGTLPWLAWQGLCALALAAVLFTEVLLTLADFVVEIRVRKPLGDVYGGERVTHAVMGIIYVAMVANLLLNLDEVVTKN